MGKHPLEEYRKQRRLTQRELARKAGVSVSLISKVESGKAFPRGENLVKIEAATGGEVTAGALVEAAIAASGAGGSHPKTGSAGMAGFSEQPQQHYEVKETTAMDAYEAKVAKGKKMLEQLYAAVGGLVTFAPGFDPAQPWSEEDCPDPQWPVYREENDVK